jgi:hypothetical protein
MAPAHSRPWRCKDVGGWHHTPSAVPSFPPPGRTRYVLHRRLVGPRGRSGRTRKSRPPPEFDPRTVQHVTRCRLHYPCRPVSENTTYCAYSRSRCQSVTQQCLNRCLIKDDNNYMFRPIAAIIRFSSESKVVVLYGVGMVMSRW